MTDWKQRYSQANWMVKISPNTINNLTKESAADCFQIRSLAQIRLIRKIGALTDVEMQKINQALISVLDLK